MKISNLAVVCIFSSALYSCSHKHNHIDAHDEHHHEHEAGKEDEHNHDDIHLTPERCMMLGVKVDEVKKSVMNSSVKVAGVIEILPQSAVVISAPSSGIVTFAPGIVTGSDIASGTRIASVSAHGMAGGDPEERERLAYEKSKRELERLEPLYKEGIVTANRYNEAVAAYDAACDAYSGESHGRAIIAHSGGVISELLVENGQYVENGTPIARILNSKRIVLRADVPVNGSVKASDIKDASFKTTGMADYVNILEAGGVKIAASTGTAPAAGANYEPVYFSLDNNWNLRPGMFAEVYVTSSQSGDNVLIVPREALIEQEGYYFVFVQETEGIFEKRPVAIGRNSGCDVEILTGIECGDSIVTEGAMMVKLAASDGKVPEGHSHNH